MAGPVKYTFTARDPVKHANDVLESRSFASCTFLVFPRQTAANVELALN